MHYGGQIGQQDDGQRFAEKYGGETVIPEQK
jgi:hypothetical protein